MNGLVHEIRDHFARGSYLYPLENDPKALAADWLATINETPVRLGWTR